MTRVLIAAAVSFLPLLPLALRASDLGDVANLIGLAGTLVSWWQVLLGVRQISHRLGDDRLAFIMFLVLWLTSTLARYLVRHRVWRYAHYLSYPLLALVFVHSWGLGSFLAETPWLQAYWLGLAVVFAGVVVWRGSVPRWAVPYRLERAERLRALGPGAVVHLAGPYGTFTR
ncbi:hypothetical protein [Nonomuraea rubra]|uniref:Ferric oxidoreductase domain-containing protein n=2 Tax=Nonomuraea rubra TaxID=46180 RepID=A0A7X0NZD6_9ACTN|nr:hypothetical protein [Nonomuraea rubra]MBB6552352.1 hypothetical protein [Nonomuraea rubra]